MTWITVEEFATWSGEAVSTIRKKCQTGELPSRKFGVRWKIDRDLFEKQAEKEMIERMERTKRIEFPRITEDSKDWLKRKRSEILAKARCLG